MPPRKAGIFHNPGAAATAGRPKKYADKGKPSACSLTKDLNPPTNPPALLCSPLGPDSKSHCLILSNPKYVAPPTATPPAIFTGNGPGIALYAAIPAVNAAGPSNTSATVFPALATASEEVSLSLSLKKSLIACQPSPILSKAEFSNLGIYSIACTMQSTAVLNS